MKILILYTDLRIGGVERFIIDLAQELAKVGQEVILATHWTEKIDELKVQNNEVPLFRRVSFGKEKGGFSLKLMFKIMRFIWREKPDVVHTNLLSLFYVCPSILLDVRNRITFCHTVHSMADKEWPTPWFRLTQYLYQKKVKVVAISQQVCFSLYQRYKSLSPFLVHNGCILDVCGREPELERQLTNLKNSHEGCKVFLHIGNISRNKNQVMLAKVASQLLNDGNNLVVAFLGREDDHQYAEELKSFCGESIRYLGYCRHVQPLLRLSDFFVLCSGYEGMPISLIEAIGNGCVPVCTPAGGVPSGCINRFNGVLAEDNTEEGLYRIMKDALEMPQESYSRYREASLKLFRERFSMEACVSAYEELYRKR